ncbi:hypothetical protein HNQ59_002666 [Chitinivorax tropicus]|uniref:Uncharacterized protein n=1 Tax=Chitinivorax tropicus TaxID=714531 RepID=A0A840MPI5_9PROT|nr:hypothetical protein [Chitinivorax tropicus]
MTGQTPVGTPRVDFYAEWKVSQLLKLLIYQV